MWPSKKLFLLFLAFWVRKSGKKVVIQRQLHNLKKHVCVLGGDNPSLSLLPTSVSCGHCRLLLLFCFVGCLVVVVDKKKVLGQWDGSVGEVKVPAAKLDDPSYRRRE